ncbi:MAG: hypothetical protein HYY30_00150 [Chloroflexi bacterium]|nr:hypothetical protein [Chloroflexota bacterium]
MSRNPLSGLPRLVHRLLIRRQVALGTLTLLVISTLLAPLPFSPALMVKIPTAPSSTKEASAIDNLSKVPVRSDSDDERGLGSVSASPGQPAGGPITFTNYRLRMAQANILVKADPPTGDLETRALQQQRDDLGAVLRSLTEAGLSGAYSFDEADNSYYAELNAAALFELNANPLVAAIEPASVSAAAIEKEESLAGISPSGVTVQTVSSVVFIQVYSPFIWGRASVGGSTVTLTLESSSGSVIGVACQTKQAEPNNYVEIDRTQLYYETIFIEPTSTSCTTGTPVTIMPGDRVHVVTSGLDPSTGIYLTEDKRIIVDDVRAWTSYERGSVTGTGPAGLPVVVTISSSSLALNQYLTPGTSMTYAELTADGGGNFSATAFRTSANPAYKTVTLQPGSTGFVRVQHQDGSEVYTVHGQNVFVLENSGTVHGWAFQLPRYPSGLDSGVIVRRPSPNVSITLKNSSGQVKDSVSGPAEPMAPNYATSFFATILADDTVEVSISQGPVISISVAQLTASVDVSGNQVTGTGPSNTAVVVQLGRINGYVRSASYFNYIQQRVNTNGSGQYRSGSFLCNNGDAVVVGPGSFGYVGFEEARGNFVYAAFAAPTNDVMADFPFLEGWVADGNARPAVALADGGGSLKSQNTATPSLIWMTNQKLFINTYYNVVTSQFIEPGDTVTISTGSRTDVIPVDNVTAYLNLDAVAVVGQAPPGATVRVVPLEGTNNVYRDVSADANGNYVAGNPYKSFSYSTCADASRTQTFNAGDFGRAYVSHADSNRVFMPYGRLMEVNENENYLEIYQFARRDIDWFGTPSGQEVTVTLTPAQGPPVIVSAASSGGQSGKWPLSKPIPWPQDVHLRARDNLSATFTEGLPFGPTRQATIAMISLPLIIGSPDVDRNTLAGVGPQSWSGQATLNPPPTAKSVAISPRGYTAFGPFGFQTSSGTPIRLMAGYSGRVFFSDNTGHRVWIAWAATGSRLEITGYLVADMTQVCGIKAPASTTVRIHDVTTSDVIIGAGTSDAQGNFCVAVSPLYKGQVIMAEADGEYSQPVVVGVFLSFLPMISSDAE